MKAIIERDQWAESPRTAFDNLSTFIFLGKHSDLGDKHDLHGDFGSFKGHEKAIRKAYDVAVLRPVYAYIHSGMTISTSPFSCPWDSGQLGFAIVTKDAIRREYGIKRVTQKYIDMASKVLEGEVETLDQYIRGDVYSVSIYDGDEFIDGCSGYYDIEQAKEEMPDYVTKIEEKTYENLLTTIHRVLQHHLGDGRQLPHRGAERRYGEHRLREVSRGRI